MAISCSKKNSAATIYAPAVPAGASKSAVFDGVNRNHFFQRITDVRRNHPAPVFRH